MVIHVPHDWDAKLLTQAPNITVETLPLSLVTCKHNQSGWQALYTKAIQSFTSGSDHISMYSKQNIDRGKGNISVYLM